MKSEIKSGSQGLLLSILMIRVQKIEKYNIAIAALSPNTATFYGFIIKILIPSTAETLAVSTAKKDVQHMSEIFMQVINLLGLAFRFFKTT